MVRDSPEEAVQFLRDYRKTLISEERASVQIPAIAQDPQLHQQVLHMCNNEEHKRIFDFQGRLSAGVEFYQVTNAEAKDG